MSNIKIGDLVTFNDRYWVSDKNKEMILKVRSDPYEASGTLCVLLEGRPGGYAVNGLRRVNAADI